MAARRAGRRSARTDRVAVIDIGSNSIRLVIFDGLSRAPSVLLNEKVLCGLGRGLGESGRLNPEGRQTALSHIERFVALAQAIGVRRLDALATAAVRDATDGVEFTEEVRRRTAIKPRILGGDEEGRFSGLGVIAGIPDAYGVMGDLGGGSVELVPVRNGRTGKGATLPLGPFRLATLADDPKRLGAAIDAHVESLPWLKRHRNEEFYAVGGAWRSLARIHMEQSRYPLHVIQAYTLSSRDAEDFLGVIARLSRRSLEQMVTASRKRLEVVPVAAEVLRRVLGALEPKRVVFSALGLREGYLFDQLPERTREEDPLLVACASLGRARPRFGLEGAEVEAWLRPIYPRRDFYDRLRLAAALLGDIAWSDHPDYRAEQAFRFGLFMPVTGLDHLERAFVAAALHARYGGAEATVRDTVSRLINDEAALAARVTGLALRLAYTLSGGAPGLLSRARVAVTRGQLVLTVPASGALQGGEAVERRLVALARAMGLEPRMQQGLRHPRPSSRKR